MGLRNIVLVTIALMLILGLFLAWVYPSTQDLMPENPFWNGLEDFSRQSRAEIAKSLDGLAAPENTVLIAISYTPYQDKDLEQIRQFVYGGGTLAILDDFGYGNSILKYLGLDGRFSGFRLSDPLFNSKNLQFPRVTNFEGKLREKKLGSILLNRPSSLLEVAAASVLARSSESSFLDSNANGRRDKDEPQGSFPVAAEIAMGKGKIVLVSDASIVINSMIGKEDNFRFLQEVLGIGEKNVINVIIDSSHIPVSALDWAKEKLAQSRNALSDQYTQIALVALVMFLALRPLWSQKNKEVVNGRRRQTT